MGLPEEITDVAQHYPASNFVACTALGSAGGFSGASFWRLTDAGGRRYCLRRWPAGTNPQRVAWIHNVVCTAVTRGCNFLAQPLMTKYGQSWVASAGNCFELAPWRPGIADFHRRPNDARLSNAMHALASFHSATESSCEPRSDVPACVTSRLGRLQQLNDGIATTIERSLRDHAAVCLADGQRIVEAFKQHRERVGTALLSVDHPARLTPCLRDVWHDHVLFVDDEVTGIVDYDAIQLDSTATDLSRLLGSLVGGDRTRWSYALDAYQEHRKLSENELRLADVLDLANVVLSGMQWLEWLFVREIRFENPANVRLRLNATTRRLFGAI